MALRLTPVANQQVIISQERILLLRRGLVGELFASYVYSHFKNFAVLELCSAWPELYAVRYARSEIATRRPMVNGSRWQWTLEYGRWSGHDRERREVATTVPPAGR